MGRKIKATVAAVAMAGAMVLAAPAAEAAPAHEAKIAAACVNTSFWGRAFSFVFMPVSWTSYLWQVKC